MKKNIQKPVQAYSNLQFLNSPQARTLRILSEFLEPMMRFKKEGIRDTIVIFGSARVLSPQSARKQMREARQEVKRKKKMTAYDRRRLESVAMDVEMSGYYEDAVKLTAMLTTWSQTLDSPYRRFVVCSGGGPGIMEAANRGAHDAGGKTIGLNIRLPFEQGANPYISPNLHFEFHYFFMRKFWFAYLAKALVVFPGGFGTLDEMFEVLTLAQTEKLSKKIEVLLYGREYWERILNFEPMIEAGAIARRDLDLFTFVDSPQHAFDCLRTHLVENYLEPATREEARAPRLARTRA
jgi:uncharacterized protein (TIGR00730 family)